MPRILPAESGADNIRRWVILFRYEPHGIDVLRFAGSNQGALFTVDFLELQVRIITGEVVLEPLVEEKEDLREAANDGCSLLTRHPHRRKVNYRSQMFFRPSGVRVQP